MPLKKVIDSLSTEQKKRLSFVVCTLSTIFWFGGIILSVVYNNYLASFMSLLPFLFYFGFQLWPSKEE